MKSALDPAFDKCNAVLDTIKDAHQKIKTQIEILHELSQVVDLDYATIILQVADELIILDDKIIESTSVLCKSLLDFCSPGYLRLDPDEER